MAALQDNEFFIEKATKRVIYIEGATDDDPNIIYFRRYSENLENFSRYMQHVTKLNDHNYDVWPCAESKKILLLKMIK